MQTLSISLTLRVFNSPCVKNIFRNRFLKFVFPYLPYSLPIFGIGGRGWNVGEGGESEFHKQVDVPRSVGQAQTDEESYDVPIGDVDIEF